MLQFAEHFKTEPVLLGETLSNNMFSIQVCRVQLETAEVI